MYEISFSVELGDLCKCQHSQFTYSLLIKRNPTIIDRVPLTKTWFEPGTPRNKDKWLTTWALHASLKVKVHLFIYIVEAAIAQCVHQGYNSIGWLLKWKSPTHGHNLVHGLLYTPLINVTLSTLPCTWHISTTMVRVVKFHSVSGMIYYIFVSQWNGI